VRGHPGLKHKLIKNMDSNRAGHVTQAIEHCAQHVQGPEFKPQYCLKDKSIMLGEEISNL
jgi:hypothetical protein